MIVALVFYGLLAGVAFWATFRNSDLMWIGIWLTSGYVISNIFHALLPVSDLPGPYSLIEFMVLFATSIAWDAHRRYWPLLVLGGVNILSICINIAFASFFPPSGRQVYLFEVTTNLCFAVECLLATGVGLFDGIRSGRFHRLPRLWRRVVASYADRGNGTSR